MRDDKKAESVERLAAATRTMFWGLMALLLTTLHHVYGAYVYDTPWRKHVAHVAGLAGTVIVGSFLVLRRRPAGVTGEIALWAMALLTLVVPVALIGFFEGGYNHALKNALYFGGASPEAMRRLFPPPTYELPNDVFFEFTGVLQLVLGLVTGSRLYRLLRPRWKVGGVLGLRHQSS